MECMQAKALKPSLRGELTQQDFVEEFYCATTTATAAGISCVAGEDFSVDDLLNLQNVDFEDGFLEEDEDEEEDEEEKDSLSLEDENSNVSGEFSVAGDSDSPLASQLAVPDDDIAELEWVSHFVDDSLSDFSLLHPLGNKKTEPEPRRTGKTPLCFPSIPVRPRTKRPRSTTRPSSLSQFTESSTSSESSPSLGFSSTSPLIFALLETVGEPERKKQKRKPAVQAGSGSAAGAQFQRRCSHCLVQKTPQWRAGPLGAKTLCNACGVRFKSGRLFPEYRPACSPTFCSDMHSNSHRKVLEMRKKKEIVGPGSGLTHAISSF